MTALTRPDLETFGRLLQTMNRGQFDDLVTSEMAHVVREMWRIAESKGGKPKGKLVVTLNLRLENGAMFIDPDLKITAPKEIKGGTVLFPDASGRLFHANPRQGDIFEGADTGAVEEPTPRPVALAR